MGLDEVTQICPVPLPAWLSDSGGKGIQVISVAHGEAQLAGRWGEHGKQVVLDTSGVKCFLPGITDTKTLDAASKLCGHAAFTEHGNDHTSRHEVATADMIRQLPARFALVIRGGAAPVIARLPAAWNDRTYKSARRRGQAIAGLTPALGAAQGEPDTASAAARARPARTRGDRRGAATRPVPARHPVPVELAGMDGFDAALRQLADTGERLALLDAREAEHFRAASGSGWPSWPAWSLASARRCRTTLPTWPACRAWTSRSPRSPPAWPASTPATVAVTVRRRRGSTGPRRRRAGGSCTARPASTPWSGWRAGWSRCTGPATGSSPPRSAPAGPTTRCACTPSTSPPNCGACSTCRPARTPGMLSAQAEYQTRILPALAEQMMTETHRCGHAQHRRTANGAATGRRP